MLDRLRGAGVLGVLVVLVASGCSGSDSSGAGVEITLRAQSVGESAVQDAALDHAVTILEDRLEAAGIPATVERARGSRVVSIRVDSEGPVDVDRVVRLATRTGRLEMYDLEANLVSPSIDATHFPVATESLYDLLVGRQTPAREEKVEAWYLFDSERKLAGGPAPTERLLLPGGELLDGWRILGVPPRTVVLECGVGELVCPGVMVLEPRSDFFYLVRYDPPRAPEMTGADIELEGTRQDFDVTTGQPIVLIQFTGQGADRFGELTNREADRGRALYNLYEGATDPRNTFQHFAIVLDREIKSWPSIDWEQYPNGISGFNGAQITGIGDIQEAKDLAAVLQTGALPVHFEVVKRPAAGG